MKKVIFGVIIGIVISTSTIYAKQINDTIQVAYNNIKISVFGQECIPKDADGDIVEPFIYEDTTYVPIRAISQAFGKRVDWNDKTKTVEIRQPFSSQEVSKGQEAIKIFFDYFAEHNQYNMQKLLSEPFSQYDISDSVYGMKSAILSGIEYVEENSNWSTGTLVFNCTFDNVEFSPNASNNNGDNKSACYILVHKDGDIYTISDFVSGL